MLPHFFLALALLAEPEPPPAAPSVIVLTSGKSIVARQVSWEGRLVKLVDVKGQALVLKAELVDREKTEAATAAHREELAAGERRREEAVEAAAAAAETRTRQREKIAAQRKNRKTRGNLVLAPEIPEERQPKPLRDPARPPREAVQEQGGLSEGARKQMRGLIQKRRDLVVEHNELIKKLNDDPMADYASGRIRAQALRDQIDEIDRQIETIQERDARDR